MILKQFNDNYDAEFVSLMLDIQNLIINFCKSDKLKINSWAKILCVPTINIEFKKNRNLYAIKLLDNVLNGKLEEPFDKFAKDKELKKLNPILVKTQLTSKFLNEIKKYESFNNIANYNPQFEEFDPYNYEEYKSNKFSRGNTQNNFYKNNIKRKNAQNKKFYIDYDNQFLLVPSGHKRSKSSYKVSNWIGNNNDFRRGNDNNYIFNDQELRPSDILLIQNFGNFPYKNKSNLMNLKYNYKYNKFEKNKLKNLIDRLNDQRLQNIEIIMNQKNEIDKLKKKVSQMQLKIKKVFDSQK